MGARTNIVVIQNGQWQLYYDHWAATLLHIDLLWGPSLTLDYVQRMQTMPSNTWLDEVWCEGAALLDCDQHHLLWFNQELGYSLPERQAFLALMSHRWLGWTVSWASQGLVSLVRYLGLPEDVVLYANFDDKPYPFQPASEFPEDHLTLLSIKYQGRYRVGRNHVATSRQFGLRESDLPVLQDYLQATNLVWPAHIEVPHNGVHIDCDERTVYYWQSAILGRGPERLAAAWPNWRTVYINDDPIQTHLRLLPLDIQLPTPNLEQLQRQWIATIRTQYTHTDENPAQKLAQYLTHEGHDVEVNPYTKYTVNSVGDGYKLAILDQLEVRLPIL